ncbi:DUF4091 domain-containing protein [Diplocloster modestus]|uniref:DUF4091 domain-containing protein n=1 Tax=Diplocloster modestus TaxID=2850322 RepID=A0ABS6K4K0_9FIRM|nr:glycoside hydrolase domain-containing protein [Diplocloster modestus]MBU9725465.1 DUF4091 domain-containing protein [Diplocloster modestus]
MEFKLLSETEWAYPDTPLTTETPEISLEAAAGGHTGFQILAKACAGSVSILWDDKPLSADIFSLLPVVVDENTAPGLMTTTDYESCKGYVTKKAPFEVYDALMPYDKMKTGSSRAFYIRISVSEGAEPSVCTGRLVYKTGREECTIRISCRVHPVKIPSLFEASLGMLNFFDYDNLFLQHNVPRGSESYWSLFRQYVRMQLSLRCTHILLPPGSPLYHDGQLEGFDFSDAETAGRIALEEGAPFLCGGHIAHWNEWTENEYYPIWDADTGVTTLNGYFQLKKYFTGWADVIRRNNWSNQMCQSLADEPQIHNAGTYRILAAVFRKFLPGIPIIEAVETADLGGGVDIWVPKQDTYEKNREVYDLLKKNGEELWFYTCAFPAGPTMNRSMDLPLTVTRAVLWLGAAYRLTGFLHWGFNFYIGEDIFRKSCCPHKGKLLPAGDAHIVYPGDGFVLPSIRLEAQRAGAEDYELLWQLIKKDPQKADKIIASVCTSFTSYTRDAGVLLKARRSLFQALCSDRETDF